MIEYRQTKAGKWRAYTVTQQALSHWRGPNYKVVVIRDTDDRIVEQWYWVSYEGVKLPDAGERVHAAWQRIRQQAKEMGK